VLLLLLLLFVMVSKTALNLKYIKLYPVTIDFKLTLILLMWRIG